MTFLGVEFVVDSDEELGEIALIHTAWLTPLKKQTWWPPYKTSVKFRKALSIGEEPKDTWSLHNIKRTLFTCGMYNNTMFFMPYIIDLSYICILLALLNYYNHLYFSTNIFYNVAKYYL